MDRDLREAERSGDPVAVLRERLRAGELTRKHVELAASLGHPVAGALYPEAAALVWTAQALEAKAKAVLEASQLLGETLPARVAADWAESVLPVFESMRPGINKVPREAIAAARAWAECPCEEHRLAAAAAGSEAASAAEAIDDEEDADDRKGAYAADAAQGACLAANAGTETAALFAAKAARSATRALERSDAERKWQSLRLAAYVLGEVE
jgi:hypothetical protein